MQSYSVVGMIKEKREGNVWCHRSWWCILPTHAVTGGQVLPPLMWEDLGRQSMPPTARSHDNCRFFSLSLSLSPSCILSAAIFSEGSLSRSLRSRVQTQLVRTWLFITHQCWVLQRTGRWRMPVWAGETGKGREICISFPLPKLK